VRLIKAGIRQGKGHLGGGSNGQQWTYWATFPPFFLAFFHLNRVWERAKERSCHAQINQEPASAADENSPAFHFTQELLISPQQRKDLILIICKTNITAARGFHFNIKTPCGRNFLWKIALRRLNCDALLDFVWISLEKVMSLRLHGEGYVKFHYVLLI
jgi:hypothetical protein